MVAPKLGESVLDPACGTGGFLIDTLEYIRKNEVKTQADEKKLQGQIRGVELKPLPHLLAITNMILHDVGTRSLFAAEICLPSLCANTGRKIGGRYCGKSSFWGAVKDGVEKNFPAEFRTKETADLFLVLFIHLLKPNGRAGIVLPDGSLFGEGGKDRHQEETT